jgi:hypothetical protein
MDAHSTSAWISAPEIDKESLFRGRAEELCKPSPLYLKTPKLTSVLLRPFNNHYQGKDIRAFYSEN